MSHDAAPYYVRVDYATPRCRMQKRAQGFARRLGMSPAPILRRRDAAYRRRAGRHRRLIFCATAAWPQLVSLQAVGQKLLGCIAAASPGQREADGEHHFRLGLGLSPYASRQMYALMV